MNLKKDNLNIHPKTWYHKQLEEFERLNSEMYLKNFQAAKPNFDNQNIKVPIIYGTGSDVEQNKGGLENLFYCKKEEEEEEEEEGVFGLINAVASYRSKYRYSPLTGNYPGPTKL